jgi:hypothetical protein
LNAASGWVLAAVALVAGYLAYGWRGLLLGTSVVVFWLLLQLSRSLRALRQAGSRPVGQIDNAVMFQAQLQTGQPLVQVLKLTGSLGVKLADTPQTYRWADAAGDAVRVELQSGKVSRWTLERVPKSATADLAAQPGPPGTGR